MNAAEYATGQSEVINLAGRLTHDGAVTASSEPTRRKMRIAGQRRCGKNGQDTGARRKQQLDALWAMSPADRVAAMWRGELTLFQLTRWSSRAPHEVPLLGGEFAYIVMQTPEWAESADAVSDNVSYPRERQDDRAAA